MITNDNLQDHLICEIVEEKLLRMLSSPQPQVASHTEVVNDEVQQALETMATTGTQAAPAIS